MTDQDLFWSINKMQGYFKTANSIRNGLIHKRTLFSILHILFAVLLVDEDAILLLPDEPGNHAEQGHSVGGCNVAVVT